MIKSERHGGAANVDDPEPRALQSRYVALSQRCDRRGMGGDCLPHSARSPGRAQAKRQYPRGVQRAAVCVEHGVSVAGASYGSAAAQYDLSLLWALGSRWHVTADSRGTLYEVSGATGPLVESDGLYPRQSECEECGKRGCSVDPSGFDAGKQVKGKKRHLLVDTLGLVLHAIVHPATLQDRDGGLLLFAALADRCPLLKKLFADGAYQGPRFREALAQVRPQLSLEIVTRSEQIKGFAVLPKRWIVERTIAWLNRCRRLAKDWENRTRYALAFVHLASIRLMLRKLCNPS